MLFRSTNPARALESHRTTETEPKAEVDEHLRLLPAAVECMRDATANADTAQLLEDRIDRTAHVQDHRQVVTPRQLELRDEKIELAGGVDVGDEVIETDLADCPRRAAHKAIDPGCWDNLVGGMVMALLSAISYFLLKPAYEKMKASGRIK